MRAHRSLDLFQAHHLGDGGRRGSLPWLLGGFLSDRLAPDGCVSLKLGYVLRLLVGLIASARGLGGAGLRHWLPGMMQCLLLEQSVPDLCGLASEIEVSADSFPGDRLVTAERVVVEVISSLLQTLSKTVVGVLKVQYLGCVLPTAAESCEWIVRLEHASCARLGGLIARQGRVETEERHGGGCGAGARSSRRTGWLLGSRC